MRSFPYYKQLNIMDCGPACLRMIARYYGKHFKADTIRQNMGYSKWGVSLLDISVAATKMGFRSKAVQLSYQQLVDDIQLPCILHWDQNHFVVLANQRNMVFSRKEEFLVADPARSLIRYTKKELLEHWLSAESEKSGSAGTALLLEPTPDFYQTEDEKEDKLDWRLIMAYLKQSRWQMLQVFIALIITSLLSLLLPFLTQSIVDTGITTQNLQFLTIVLLAQFVLIFSRTIVDFIRTRLLMKVSSIVNLSILSDFWIKVTRLPVSYFDSHQVGDTMQRLNDNRTIQNFLTGNSINTLFSLVNFFIYSVVLILYSPLLFIIFLTGSVLYFLWIYYFLRVRRKVNYKTFHLSVKENSATLQLIQGMHELKLHNAENLKRWEWENIQASLFKLNLKNLNYSQLQQAGAVLINQGKDIFITFLVAKYVIEGRLTFGTMLAIQYILGQLTSPIEQLVSFFQSAQDAKISMERLNEIHSLKSEDNNKNSNIKSLPADKTLKLKSVSFRYPGADNKPVLNDITLEIPAGKVTAIVGVSGSGKTSLLKLLLKFYDFYDGEIKICDINFKYISPAYWRSQCGSVMQNGYIFNDSIARNICIGDETINLAKLTGCCKTANILPFIESLPNGFNTKLGDEGLGISQGQKQRLLIARAVYKDPEYLFFDEATNALDAYNEKIILENLKVFFRYRTVVVVAHRLSTVKNADKIIVMDEGCIIEEGTHEQLTRKKGKYYELVKNQLELGN